MNISQTNREIAFILPRGRHAPAVSVFIANLQDEILRIAIAPPKKITYRTLPSDPNYPEYTLHAFKWNSVDVRDSIVSVLRKNRCTVLTKPFDDASIYS